MEIDRLLRLLDEQKRKIAELDSDVIASKFVSSNLRSSLDVENLQKQRSQISDSYAHTEKNIGHKNVQQTFRKALSGSAKLDSVANEAKESLDQIKSSPPGLQYDHKMGSKCWYEVGGCIKWMREPLEKDMTLRQEQASQQIESLRKLKELC
ncbi:unnamed protein product [Diabrotica balteata]|uniref:Uncharacterized protein n=1 Tax=Diabrotica balteata TaxID=107213 RepID=A0A9N9T4L8_DIABA|nr:unnamed protein product [Diabrotica balteata]